MATEERGSELNNVVEQGRTRFKLQNFKMFKDFFFRNFCFVFFSVFFFISDTCCFFLAPCFPDGSVVHFVRCLTIKCAIVPKSSFFFF